MEMTGESNDSRDSAVPVTAFTVTRTEAEEICGYVVHMTFVEVDHAAVWHSASAVLTVAVMSVETKFNPSTVRELPPDRGTFKLNIDTTGASNDSSIDAVPATAPTVTAITNT